MRQTDNRQIQFTAIDLSNDAASIYNFGTQKSALGGLGIIAIALPMLDTATAPNIRMDFDNILLNMMALLLSISDLDCHEDGIAVIEPSDLYFLTARLGEQPCFHSIIALCNYGYHLQLIRSVTVDGCGTSPAAGETAEKYT